MRLAVGEPEEGAGRDGPGWILRIVIGISRP